MPVPFLTRVANIVRYDGERGVVLALDQRRYPAEQAYRAFDSAEAVAGGLADWRGGAAAVLAGYGLALTARSWRGRPSEARRAAIIQTAEQLRQSRPQNFRLRRVLEAGVSLADAAILRGDDAAEALATLVDGELRRVDRDAERCGRIAAELVDEGDDVLVDGFFGGALSWMLAVAQVEQRDVRLTIFQGAPDAEGSRLGAQQATEIGLSLTTIDDAALAGGPPAAALYVVASQWVALDGTVATEPPAARRAKLVRAHGIPCYVLAPDGPDPETADGAQMGPRAGATIQADAISAIITSRGIYRPEKIAGHLRDGDAPLDFIPLG